MGSSVRPLLIEGESCWTLAQASQAGLLVDARDYYLAFYRAALEARRYILMAGWQFDSTVELLRGEDRAVADAAGGKTTLLAFLNHLCETRPELEIYMLAWDFHMVLALEREWMQQLLFDWTTHDRLHFQFDGKHPDGGCHHQKLVIVDGTLAFLGGMDICESRWDDRRHLAANGLRLGRSGRRQKPYHDVQAYVAGRRAVAPLERLFCERWKRSGSEPFVLPADAGRDFDDCRPEGSLILPAGTVGYSRTDPLEGDDGVEEIAHQLASAIDAAERLVYIENQYFSSRVIRDALERRLRARGRSRLDLVLVLNRRAEAVKEEIAVGLRQAENLARVRQAAADGGHALGCYFTSPRAGAGRTVRSTYIHSKVTIVDDRFLCVGSANLTNRSMGLDTELNLSWDTARHERPEALERAIRRVRVSLLAEHTGLQGARAIRPLVRTCGLVDVLDAVADASDARLSPHPSPTPAEVRALAIVDPQQLPFDPASPDEDQHESEEQKRLFRAGISDLWDQMTG